MDVRIFFSTFILVFLAELGDKTQLTSLALSAGSKAPWSVFAGAVFALVSSTLIAVLLGSTLQRLIPAYYVRLGAAVFFFLFGVFFFFSAFQSKLKVAAGPATVLSGGSRQPLLARLVLKAAISFEQASSIDYRKMAEKTGDGSLRDVFLQMAKEEEAHLDHLRAMTNNHGDAIWNGISSLPAVIDGPAPNAEALSLLDAAIAHERMTSSFYRELAKTAPLASVSAALNRMAEEEESHVRRLQRYCQQKITNSLA